LAPPAPRPSTVGTLQPSSYYDAVYESGAAYNAPYFESPYYFLWSVIADRLQRDGAMTLLDLGCGPGQVAHLLHDKGLSTRYVGLDFSERSIQMAKELCPGYDFLQADLTTPKLLESFEYDCVLALEVLEHLDDDIALLRQVRPGARVLATVPNFSDPAHVRYFRDAARVRERYASLFATVTVDTFAASRRNKLFLLDGIRGM
jgi:2-polyprenyl-3-methyl-5-hydroxy-6-metoxy-1,4-benzoquinol methylase